ncbi:MAG: polymer-forming cytoskeletal protein [Treponema sp.]|jgi:cytoskeletal protein CcmA (bactofilin family)|nr:polymer-forming cytoskeletal protein [Treponema sp.]
MFDEKDSDLFELEEEDYDTVMASDITFSGNIRFSKPFMIKGSVSGKIEATGDLAIDTDATVFADITASRVLIKGKVEGDVVGKKLVFISSTGSVKGDVTTAQIVLEPGSSFFGKCTMLK